ncbi:hypothetical protein Pcinc_041817 [Petrolisthes cinctipes]|uniref:Uncharacterized protein n=1 Tax=Petrolisthes cinctipes TaxID=88211 RepID=A0AAE1BLA2_PETCI|nr:hypothetical protein Pcinc_041817 [Petrolisthes cinctipes]
MRRSWELRLTPHPPRAYSWVTGVTPSTRGSGGVTGASCGQGRVGWGHGRGEKGASCWQGRGEGLQERGDHERVLGKGDHGGDHGGRGGKEMALEKDYEGRWRSGRGSGGVTVGH